MPRLSPLLGIALACVVATTHSISIAAPSGIWRCAGNSYSDAPCSGGTQLDSPAPPSAQERSQRDASTRRDQAAADRMQRERLQLEAQPGQAVVIGSTSRDSFGAPTSPGLAKPDKKKKSARTRKSDEFVATYADPHTQPAGKKKKSRK